MTDEELALACQRGDKAAWEGLYVKYKPLVLSVARRFFLSGGDTEDLVQEGMCGLYSAVTGFKSGNGAFHAYAGRCIRNRILDAVKMNSGAKHSALNNFLPLMEVGSEWAAVENPEDEIINREEKKEFLQKMNKALSALEFKAIIMYTDGMTMSEISGALGKNMKSIDNALNRAKNKLQKLIGEDT